MRRRWRRPRWATTSTARTRPCSSSSDGWPSCSATRTRCSRPTGSMANVLAVASLVAPGQEVLCEASAHIARAELGAHGAVTGADDAHLARPARAGRPRRDPGDVRTRHGAVLRPHHGGLGREHPQLRRRRRAPARGPAGAADVGRVGRRGRPPRRGPDLERARRHRRPARGVRRVRRRDGGLPVQGAGRARRARSSWARRTRWPRRGYAASGWAAGCARSASWPPPGCTRSTTTSTASPTTTPTPACWPRPAASTPRPSTPTSSSSSATTLPQFVAGAKEGGVLVAPVGPRAVRLVTHLDVSADDAKTAAGVLARL